MLLLSNGTTAHFIVLYENPKCDKAFIVYHIPTRLTKNIKTVKNSLQLQNGFAT